MSERSETGSTEVESGTLQNAVQAAKGSGYGGIDWPLVKKPVFEPDSI
jgi:hypothetical protein